jgi:DNA-binding transcriptional LysR family regulator
MDINQAKTFLTLVKVRNFHKAAKKLHVTQSTISARVKKLEEHLGCILFIRNKAGVTLTDAAIKFKRHADSIVQLWEHAREETSHNEIITESLTIGARYGLWEPLLLDWLLYLKPQIPNAVINAQNGTATDLIQKLHNGTIDLCIVYTPYEYEGLKSEKLFEEQFVMVSKNPTSGSATDNDYMYVNWGSEFKRKHTLLFPKFSYANISTNLGALAEKLIHNADVMGYLPLRTTTKEIDCGKLFVVKDTPIITLPVYLIYSEFIQPETLTIIKDSLRKHCETISNE